MPETLGYSRMVPGDRSEEVGGVRQLRRKSQYKGLLLTLGISCFPELSEGGENRRLGYYLLAPAPH